MMHRTWEAGEAAGEEVCFDKGEGAHGKPRSEDDERIVVGQSMARAVTQRVQGDRRG